MQQANREPAPVTTMMMDETFLSLCAALAVEMRDIGRLIEQLAGPLTGDERLVLAYLDQLQAFDLLAQRAGEGADLLDRLAAGHSADTAIGDIRLEAMQQRLRAAVKGG